MTQMCGPNKEAQGILPDALLRPRSACNDYQGGIKVTKIFERTFVPLTIQPSAGDVFQIPVGWLT
jgi:hypothetical protein